MFPLLVFAHRGEAAGFLKRDGPWKSRDGEGRLYQNRHAFLLLCGEGIMEAALHTTATLSKYGEDISSVVNLGIAGGLSPGVKMDSIVAVRTGYFHDSHEMQFTSFQGGGARAF